MFFLYILECKYSLKNTGKTMLYVAHWICIDRVNLQVSLLVS